jgi:hypothetical protein
MDSSPSVSHVNKKRIVRFEVSTAVTMMIIISQRMIIIKKRIANTWELLTSSSGIGSSVITISIFDDVCNDSFRNTGNTLPLCTAECPEILYCIYLPKIFTKIKCVGNNASIPNLVLVTNNIPIRTNIIELNLWSALQS